MEKNQWVGLTADKFEPYKNWITSKNGLCGTNAASVFIAFYQDNLDETIVPSFIREKNSKNNTHLVHFLRLFIQKRGWPTIAFQLAHGLSSYFSYFGLSYQARATMIGGWQRVTKRIDQGKPVIIGLNKYLGSSYGNHWVVAYAYKETDKGQRFVKIHDNWGSYQKIIPAKWINGTISLP